jgi:Domain of unknown function (DUF4345)
MLNAFSASSEEVVTSSIGCRNSAPTSDSPSLPQGNWLRRVVRPLQPPLCRAHQTGGMTLSKAALAVAAAGFAGFGVACLARPRQMLSCVDIKPSSPIGTTELRAMYGGMELGLGAFFLMAMSKPEWVRPALAAQALGLGGLAAARLASVLHDRPRGALMKSLVVAEASAAALAAIALLADQRRAALRGVA